MVADKDLSECSSSKHKWADLSVQTKCNFTEMAEWNANNSVFWSIWLGDEKRIRLVKQSSSSDLIVLDLLRELHNLE